MVGNIPQLVAPLYNNTAASMAVTGKVLYIPLEFWFARNPGLALPLIALTKVGQKSIQPKIFENYSREKLLGSQGHFFGQTQMLVSCC